MVLQFLCDKGGREERLRVSSQQQGKLEILVVLPGVDQFPVLAGQEGQCPSRGR